VTLPERRVDWRFRGHALEAFSARRSAVVVERERRATPLTALLGATGEFARRLDRPADLRDEPIRRAVLEFPEALCARWEVAAVMLTLGADLVDLLTVSVDV